MHSMIGGDDVEGVAEEVFEPLQGRLLPAMLMATPQLINASSSTRKPSLGCETNTSAFSVTILALINARLAAYPP